MSTGWNVLVISKRVNINHFYTLIYDKQLHPIKNRRIFIILLDISKIIELQVIFITFNWAQTSIPTVNSLNSLLISSLNFLCTFFGIMWSYSLINRCFSDSYLRMSSFMIGWSKSLNLVSNFFNYWLSGDLSGDQLWWMSGVALSHGFL